MSFHTRISYWNLGLVSVLLLAQTAATTSFAQTKKNARNDWPTFGGGPSRNMVNLVAKNVPTQWHVEDGKLRNIKWIAELGNGAYSGPVIAGGRVFVGTNNRRPRNPAVRGPKAVLMCFRERDGKFLWQAVHKMPPTKRVTVGMYSTPTVEGDRVYYLAPACELVCADAKTGKVVWTLDMMKTLDVHPCYVAKNSPLIVGNLLFVLTSNGVNPKTGRLVKPKAPSFIAVDKRNGNIVWQSSLPGTRIIEGQWSNAAYANVKGVEQVIFPGGDCWLYGLGPRTGKLLWKFHCNLEKEVSEVRKRGWLPNYLVASPVVHENKVYVGVGMPPIRDQARSYVGHFWCVDLDKAIRFGKSNKNHDVSPKNDIVDPKAAVNRSSALAWHFGGLRNPRPKFARSVYFGRTISTAAIHDGLVYIPEDSGYLHCLDAKTGKTYWEYDFRTEIWSSAYWADGRIYIGTDDGEVFIFRHGKKLSLITPRRVTIVLSNGQKKKVVEPVPICMEEPVYTTPVVANGALYIMTRSKLYAIGR